MDGTRKLEKKKNKTISAERGAEILTAVGEIHKEYIFHMREVETGLAVDDPSFLTH